MYPKPDFDNHYIGNRLPVCDELTACAFLSKGARYEVQAELVSAQVVLSQDSALSLALSLTEVGSVRQKVDTSVATAVQVLGALLEERNLGTEELLQHLSGHASVAVTPGVEGSYVKSLKAVAQDFTNQVEKKIADSQAATHRSDEACLLPAGQQRLRI